MWNSKFSYINSFFFVLSFPSHLCLILASFVFYIYVSKGFAYIFCYIEWKRGPVNIKICNIYIQKFVVLSLILGHNNITLLLIRVKYITIVPGVHCLVLWKIALEIYMVAAGPCMNLISSYQALKLIHFRRNRVNPHRPLVKRKPPFSPLLAVHYRSGLLKILVTDRSHKFLRAFRIKLGFSGKMT